jgi:hypothetical protein
MYLDEPNWHLKGGYWKGSRTNWSPRVQYGTHSLEVDRQTGSWGESEGVVTIADEKERKIRDHYPD